MKKQFETIVNDICNVSSWRKPYNINPEASEEEKKELRMAAFSERQGAIGVACVLAYMKGCKPDLDPLAHTIGVTSEEVEEPLKRLVVNGIFSARQDTKNDPVLLGKSKDIFISGSNIKYSSSEQTRNAWCNIAGIASGQTGLRD